LTKYKWVAFPTRHAMLMISSAVCSGLGRCGPIPLTPPMPSTSPRHPFTFSSADRCCSRPDIVTMAKPLANGFPIGAILVCDHIAEVISVGSHGTTFGGQPLATRIGTHVLSRLNDPEFITHLNDTASHFDGLLQRLPELFPTLVKGPIRGRGLIRGIPFTSGTAPAELVRLARERGVLLLAAGKDAVRCVPALIASKEECDRAVGVMESCLHLMVEDGWGEKST
jgi:acetylornithine aminotransferase